MVTIIDVTAGCVCNRRLLTCRLHYVYTTRKGVPDSGLVEPLNRVTVFKSRSSTRTILYVSFYKSTVERHKSISPSIRRLQLARIDRFSATKWSWGSPNTNWSPDIYDQLLWQVCILHVILLHTVWTVIFYFIFLQIEHIYKSQSSTRIECRATTSKETASRQKNSTHYVDRRFPYKLTESATREALQVVSNTSYSRMYTYRSVRGKWAYDSMLHGCLTPLSHVTCMQYVIRMDAGLVLWSVSGQYEGVSLERLQSAFLAFAGR